MRGELILTAVHRSVTVLVQFMTVGMLQKAKCNSSQWYSMNMVTHKYYLSYAWYLLFSGCTYHMKSCMQDFIQAIDGYPNRSHCTSDHCTIAIQAISSECAYQLQRLETILSASYVFTVAKFRLVTNMQLSLLPIAYIIVIAHADDCPCMYRRW